MSEWQISRALGQCYDTGHEFKPGQDYYAALVETEDGFERRDFSVEYWLSDKPETYCFWKTRMADEKQKKRLFVSDEMLMAFFERLAEETEPARVNFRFVLTLVLMRKRRLKYDSAENIEDREVWTLRVTGENRMVKVVNPHLAEDQIEQLSAQMGQILQVDL